jgi:phosphoribosylaminoimidazole carboxylase
MLAQEAALLNVPLVFLDVGSDTPAKQVISPRSSDHAHVDGSFADPAKIRELAAKVDILTIEIEHVDAAVLGDVQSEPNVEVHPAPSTVRTIQHKFTQKEHLERAGCAVAPFARVDTSNIEESIATLAKEFGLPLMLKSCTQGYDGRGNFVVRDIAQARGALTALGGDNGRELYAEKWVPFTKEIAVMVVRARDGTTRAYPAVETVHKDSICHLVSVPLRGTDPTLGKRAQDLAERAVQTFEGAGVFGVEMFLLNDGEYASEVLPVRKLISNVGSLLINEIAPRPHNSGHYTIEACETSQYGNHLRAILGLPLGSTELKVPAACMLNLIGLSDSLDDLQPVIRAALETPGATVHLYGKAACRKGRKMGHVTLVAPSDAALAARLRPLLSALPSSPDAETDLYAPAPPARAHSSSRPLVGIIMGSDSDLPVMRPAAEIMERFAIPYELTIVSAHRTPDRLVQYARSASARGLRVIIAGAGGAAHLPGMVAAMTGLPVIGVPVKGSSLDGVDSLHSIVQMPVSE